MKNEFKVGDITFDTRRTQMAFGSYMQDQAAGRTMTEWFDQKKITTDPDPLISRHAHLLERFKQRIASMNLKERNIPLGVSDYGLPFIIYTNQGQVITDKSALRLMTPDEMDALLVHELAHIEKGHKPGVYARQEFEADARAAEVTGNPQAVRSALMKVEQFNREFEAASPRIAFAHGISRLVNGMYHVITGKEGSGLYPPHYQRDNRLRKMESHASRAVTSPEGGIENTR